MTSEGCKDDSAPWRGECWKLRQGFREGGIKVETGNVLGNRGRDS